ncbi:MAG: preprotein translocase subunit SecG [SAR324 cluster bacterium]|nr:preprotein translocase subunit SecG [SAR324 cluster bacterium]
MFIFLLTIYIIVSISLILIVLLQLGQGAEMGAAFGSVTQGQTPYTPENFLGKLTTYIAITFMVLSLGLAYLSTKDRSGSVLDGDEVIINQPVVPVVPLVGSDLPEGETEKELDSLDADTNEDGTTNN